MSVIKPLIDPSYVQLSDENGIPIAGHLTISEANKKGLWHLGIHVVVINKKTRTLLVQKRSPRMFTHPSKLELSLGGALKYGETFEEAALREAREETGINANGESLRYLSQFRDSQIFPKLKIQSKVFGRSYLLFLDDEPRLKPQDEETKETFFIPYHEARKLITTGSHGAYGRLVPDRSYYQQLLHDIEPYLK